MISNHHPMTYSHPYAWLILLAIMAAGALIRQFFVLRHRGQTRSLFVVMAVLLLLAVFIVLAPKSSSATAAGSVTFAQVKTVINARCITCHAAQPTFAGTIQPPKGVMLESTEQIIAHAQKINETVASRYMPIANLTQMTDGEREIIAVWFRDGAKVR